MSEGSEEALDSSAEAVALADVIKRLMTAATLAEGFAEAMRSLDARLKVRRGVIFVADPRQRTLSVDQVYGSSPEALRPRYGLGVAGRVAEGGRPLVVPSVRQEPMALSELSDPLDWQNELLSLVCVPLLFAGRCHGALSVYFDHDATTGFAAKVAVLTALAPPIARLLWSEPKVGPGHTGGASSAVFEYANMIGASAAMRQVYEEVGQVAQTSATALILGESGTGKELVAQAIHANSERARQPFIKVNSAAFPDTLFESELFGHERGAFTGAVSRKKGRLDLAQGGTLFLDEIGELPLATQVKLLRVLQSREYERLGGTETLKANVRLVAATNKNMAAAVASGTFREDLFYRLNVFTITLPALRDRRGDIPALAEYFLDKHAREHRREARRISSDAIDLLCEYSWPGNVRELENAIERAVVVCNGILVEERHFPEAIRAGATVKNNGKQSLAQAVESVERSMIEEALREADGNLARASRALGATERIIRYKVQKYDLGTLCTRTSGRSGVGTRRHQP
ncbi:MAG: sigma 54-interacting transcriptional regulator [Myxococcota bacterium]|nr:sigma 54-interacting transcriptional regulator [Myxococcota bacterium]